jgi:GIY-YIG catalytic domain-containing protein
VAVAPGRIYTGLTGATKWPSGKTVGSSLGGRIGGNHLRGTVRGSTFRRTLAAALRRSLGLGVVGPGRLSRTGEQELTKWMLAHLEVAVHPFAGADALSDLERRVLAELDPALNLDGMTPTAVRVALSGCGLSSASGTCRRLRERSYADGDAPLREHAVCEPLDLCLTACAGPRRTAVCAASCSRCLH